MVGRSHKKDEGKERDETSKPVTLSLDIAYTIDREISMSINFHDNKNEMHKNFSR